MFRWLVLGWQVVLLSVPLQSSAQGVWGRGLYTQSIYQQVPVVFQSEGIYLLMVFEADRELLKYEVCGGIEFAWTGFTRKFNDNCMPLGEYREDKKGHYYTLEEAAFASQFFVESLEVIRSNYGNQASPSTLNSLSQLIDLSRSESQPPLGEPVFTRDSMRPSIEFVRVSSRLDLPRTVITALHESLIEAANKISTPDYRDLDMERQEIPRPEWEEDNELMHLVGRPFRPDET